MTLIVPPKCSHTGVRDSHKSRTRTFSPQWGVRALCLGQKGPSGTCRHTNLTWQVARSSQVLGRVLAPVWGRFGACGACWVQPAFRSWPGRAGGMWPPAVLLALGALAAHLPRLPPGWSCSPPPPCRPVTACPDAVTSTPSPSLARQVPGPASPASTPNPETQTVAGPALLPRQAPRHSYASCLQALCLSEPRSPCHESRG